MYNQETPMESNLKRCPRKLCEYLLINKIRSEDDFIYISSMVWKTNKAILKIKYM